MPHIAGVDDGYRHQRKLARFVACEEYGSSPLKWYDLAPAAAAVPSKKHASARACVDSEIRAGRLHASGACGFAIVHRCGADFYFLLVTIWRGSNEAWEAVYYSDPEHPDFLPFPPAYPPLGAFRPTFCVWELGIVAFEAAAWSHFLSSSRDDAALNAWKAATFDGEV